MSVTGNIKDALGITINKKPHLKACFMGTRRTDPYCSHLNLFQVKNHIIYRIIYKLIIL